MCVALIPGSIILTVVLVLLIYDVVALVLFVKIYMCWCVVGLMLIQMLHVLWSVDVDKYYCCVVFDGSGVCIPFYVLVN